MAVIVRRARPEGIAGRHRDTGREPRDARYTAAVAFLTRLLPLAVLVLGCDEPPRPATPDAAPSAPAKRAKAPPPRPDPEPLPEPRPRVVPLETAADVRSAIRGATGSMSALWTMVDPAQGLSVHRVDDATSLNHCRLDETSGRDFPYMLDSGDRWSCDESLARCTSVDIADASGYSFHFRASEGHRRLAAIVRYSGRRVPAEDSAEVAAFVAASGSVCRLRAVVAAAREHAPAEAEMPAELWRYRHPLQGADDDTPEGAAEEHHLCGAEARAATATLLRELGALGDPVSCDHAPLSCTYSSPMAERRLFAHLAPTGRVVPWAVAELASLPSPGDLARQERDVRAFLQRADGAPCP